MNMVEWLFTGLILSWFALLTLIGWWVKQALTEAASKEGAKKEKQICIEGPKERGRL